MKNDAITKTSSLEKITLNKKAAIYTVTQDIMKIIWGSILIS